MIWIGRLRSRPTFVLIRRLRRWLFLHARSAISRLLCQGQVQELGSVPLAVARGLTLRGRLTLARFRSRSRP